MVNLRNLVDQFDKAYSVPSSIVVTSGAAPTDIRQTCDTVKDFEDFLGMTGMDIRYPGLVTYEKENNRFLGYKKNTEGELVWTELEGLGSEALPPQVENRISELENKINSMYLEFEEQQNLLFE